MAHKYNTWAQKHCHFAMLALGAHDRGASRRVCDGGGAVQRDSALVFNKLAQQYCVLVLRKPGAAVL